jgi:hypothetical protein
MTCNQSLDLRGTSQDLTGLIAAVNTLTQRIETMHEELSEFIARMDIATTAIAARIENLISDPALPPALKARLEEEVAQLEALGKDPQNPIPEPPTP